MILLTAEVLLGLQQDKSLCDIRGLEYKRLQTQIHVFSLVFPTAFFNGSPLGAFVRWWWRDTISSVSFQEKLGDATRDVRMHQTLQQVVSGYQREPCSFIILRPGLCGLVLLCSTVTCTFSGRLWANSAVLLRRSTVCGSVDLSIVRDRLLQLVSLTADEEEMRSKWSEGRRNICPVSVRLYFLSSPRLVGGKAPLSVSTARHRQVQVPHVFTMGGLLFLPQEEKPQIKNIYFNTIRTKMYIYSIPNFKRALCLENLFFLSLYYKNAQILTQISWQKFMQTRYNLCILWSSQTWMR